MDVIDFSPFTAEIRHQMAKSENTKSKPPNLPSQFDNVLNKTDQKPVIGGTRDSSSIAHFPEKPKMVISPKETSRKAAVSAYNRQEGIYRAQAIQSHWDKYKEDQLLSHPGGDSIGLYQSITSAQSIQQESFFDRLSKDLSDAFGNVKNVYNDFMLGSTFHYRDANNQIHEAKRKGLLGSVVDFFKDAGSALTFGKWRPDGEPEPKGLLAKGWFFISKIKEAICGDLILGISGRVVQIGEDVALAGWNLLETIPDATIGNLKAGKEMTTAAFDNGQVMINYLSDIMPAGEAWQRVHSLDLAKLKPPILNNINQPERKHDDARWQYVRNTTFRKSIETAGSLVMDILTLRIFGQMSFFSDKHHGENR